MSDSRHTPGPWHISDTGPRYSVNSGNGGDSNKHVAMVSCYQCRPKDREENEANARLIAAAPALLDALEVVEWGCYRVSFLGDRMVNTCPSCGCVEENGHRDDCKLGNALKLARG